MNDYTHAGAIVYRMVNAEPKYLLVSASNDPSLTVFPKGHIEAGEDPVSAAIREVQEEAGIIVKKKQFVDVLSFDLNGSSIRSAMYLMEFIGFGDRPEGRIRYWLGYQEAMDALSFDDAKNLLRRANRQLIGAQDSR